MFSEGMESFNTQTSPKHTVFCILDKDTLKANSIALAKAKKWISSIFEMFANVSNIFQTFVSVCETLAARPLDQPLTEACEALVGFEGF